jgi:TetR/AcrR family transcriptional regulator, regulator of cefoperazone and chloramphenicol sensitivity
LPTVNRPNQATHAATRQALLEAAGAVFAEHGYRNTTVRQICRQAGANVAAVNYHFGDKQHLYLEVIRHAHSRALSKYPFELGTQGAALPEARLRAYVRAFLLRIFDPGPTSWMGRLMAMEMINPSAALDALVRERIRPMAELLGRIVSDLLGPRANSQQVRLCGCSVVSQCLFYAHCRSVLAKLYPEQKLDLEEVEQLADHITCFSLAAMKSPACFAQKPIRLGGQLRSRPARAEAASARHTVVPAGLTPTTSSHRVN